jgi:FAD/FMN-containing dehydrogenase
MSNLIERTLSRLGTGLDGRLSAWGDERYAQATAIWPKSVNRPRAIVHCCSAEDVQLAIQAAGDSHLPLSVRGGGHDWAGRSLCDGIVLDLSGMRDVVIGPDAVAAIGGGARAMDVAAEADPRGLAPVSGSVGAVGMAGLTMGGGYGPLIGRFGLALDNLIAAEVVLADGRMVLAKHNSEEELFWALRGGGGNFGVVTTMWHRLHNVPSVRSGTLVYPFSEAKAVLERCVDITASAPDELTVQVGLMTGADSVPVVLVVPTWCGAADEGEARVAPFLKLGTLLAGAAETTSYGTYLTAFDPYLANGLQVCMDSCWLPAFDSESMDLAIEAIGSATDDAGCAIFTHEFRGAASQVPDDATAFGLRRDHVLMEMLAAFPDRSDKIEERRYRLWVRTTREAFQAKAFAGGYPHFLAPDDWDRAAHSYGGNAMRLLKAKRHYDPENVFRSAIPLPAGRR